ncbi:tripartite motif-containing protein 3-like [Crassostrea angulata]|uniref:tripartite motif-containing protein 3-like n=1 Tax=Magallana angulata TaxID=2784310 RepID=UPI0022B20380|nr:tripartite motif-containing protein 3-like [Crassostrea angulata]
MDNPYSTKDVAPCSLCQIPEASMYCEVCHIHLCKACKGEHLSDSSKEHRVVPVKQCRTTLNYPLCRKHPIYKCRHHCEQCDTAICKKCIRKHSGHKLVEILQNSEDKEEGLQTELQESEKSIHPKYEEIASNISVQIDDLIKNSKILKTAIKQQGKVWQKEIEAIITNLKTDVGGNESRHIVILNKQEDEIIRTISEITQIIADLMKLLDFKDDSKSRNAELRKRPPDPKLSLSNLKPQEIDKDQLIDQSSSQSEQDNNVPTQGAESSPTDRSLLDVPRIITAIDTGYEYQYGVACLNDTEILTHGNNNIIKLYNLHGELVRSIQTESRNHPSDIAVTRNGDIVYTDYKNGTVNIVKDTRIETVIRLERWKPLNVCSTYSGDLLVVMNSDDDKHTKVVRYSGSTEKQTIQYDRRKSRPLYSSGGLFSTKYICENRNLDICVSDREANAVVVVNQAGKLRFTYTGPPSTPKESFSPLGITTDSQSRIMIADWDNDCIHILDQDGQFIRYIDNCHVLGPSGLCVDSRDNLFVADDASKVKKIQYYM